ncbi:MAG: DUF4129 domain-containing protein [Gammaproteobacteria bacterium]|nr:DUF4129 domain-containing protein [Gammaproteobacteria bacterium]
MQIDNAAIVLRPRGHWEAMDLGFLFARKHFLTLWLLWCTTAAPVFILINIVLIDSPELATLVFWWFKPVYEILLVAWLGQALFNNPPTVVEQLKQIPAVFRPDLISHITWRRLSLSRSFHMPVSILEQSQGQAYNQRLTTLHSTKPRSEWLTLLLLHIEVAFELAIPVLIVMLIPGEADFDLEQILLFEGSEYDFWVYLTEFLSISIIAPFYVSAGFFLYINARTLLEAWDLEIAFKQMTQPGHFGSSTSRVLCIVLTLGLVVAVISPAKSFAVSREQAKQTITNVLEHEDFGKKETVTTWEPIIEKHKDNREFSWPWLSNLEWLGGLLKMSGLVTIALLLIWLMMKIREYFDPSVFRRQSKKQETTKQLPDFLLIDDQQPELPSNPVAMVNELCNQGCYREALSLLYRVSLIQCIHQHQIEIPSSATENECLQLITQHNSPELKRYISVLTQTWQWLAWAGQMPSESTIRQLCANWHDHFVNPSHGI